MVEISTTPAVSEAAPQASVETSQPAAMPDLSGASQADLATLLDKLNAPQGGEQAQATPQMPQGGKPDQPAPVQIPDKFKNPDGSVNTGALAKSYAEAEKQLSQHFQMRSEYQKTQDQLQSMQKYIEEMNQWKEQVMAEQQPAAEEKSEYTPEEIAEMQSNPRSFIQKEVKKSLESYQKEQQETMKVDRQINEAINYGRANVDGFKQLEPEIAKLIESAAFNKHPDAVQHAYNAVLGQKAPELVRQAKNMGFSEGYAKAKEEMKMHVESGGKSSMPMEGGNLSEAQIKGMSMAELEKYLPKVDNSVQRENII